jgi:hypothetical protein
MLGIIRIEGHEITENLKKVDIIKKIRKMTINIEDLDLDQEIINIPEDESI